MADIFVDFSATYNGNGTAYTQAPSNGSAGAYNTLAGISPGINDFIWVRRAGAMSLSAAFAPSWAGVHVVGWPVAGDTYYSARPSAPRTAWDADVTNSLNGQYWAKIITGNASYNFAPTGIGITLHRLWVDSSLTVGGTTAIGVFTAASSVHENLCFTYSGAVGGASADLRCYSNTGLNLKVTGLYLKGSSIGSTASSLIGTINSGASDGFVSGVTVDCAFLSRGAQSTTNAAAFSVGNTAGNKSLSLQNVAINQLAGAAQHQGTALLVAAGSVHACDVTVSGQVATTWEGPGVYIAGNDCEIINMRGSNNVGTLFNAGSNNFIEVYNWNVGYPMAVAGVAYTTGGVTSPVVVSSAAASAGNTFQIKNSLLGVQSGYAKVTNLGSKNVMMLRYVDYILNSLYRVGASSQFDYDVFSMDHARALGAWAYENRHGSFIASNTYRTGGGNYSIKGSVTEMDYGQNRRAMQISVKGRERILRTLAAGANTLTLYGAYKNWAGTNETGPNRAGIGFSFDYFDNGNAFQSVNTMLNDGTALTSDSSTWVNDTGLTPFKVSVTLSNCQAQTVAINVYASPEGDSAGYFYVDPSIVVS